MFLYYATKAKRNICSKRMFKIKNKNINENKVPHFNQASVLQGRRNILSRAR